MNRQVMTKNTNSFQEDAILLPKCSTCDKEKHKKHSKVHSIDANVDSLDDGQHVSHQVTAPTGHLKHYHGI